MDKSEEREGSSRPLKIIIAVLVILLVWLSGMLIHDYFVLRKEHLINIRELSLSSFVAKHGTLTAEETGVIQPWMTFDYVNRLFGIPSDTVKTAFGITDPSYPKLTLSRYAGEAGFDENEFTRALQAAIAHYLSTPSHR